MKRMESTTKMATGKMALLMWVQKIAIEYGMKVENFDKHFKDGRVLCAIVNYYFPDELDYSLVKTENEEQILNNHKMAFDIAEIHNVFKILDPEDMLTPDRNSIMTYVASMNKEFKPLPKGVPKSQREQVMKESIEQKNEEFQTIKENILQNLLNVQNIPEVNVETKEENVEQDEKEEQERKEKEKLQQEQEKLQQEKEEKQKLEQEEEKVKKEKEEQERKEKELQQEQEKLQQEKQKLEQEEEKVKKEKEEQERKEKERIQQEILEKQENERKEKERLQQEQEKLQQEKQEKQKLEQERQEKERKEERLQQEILEKQEREKKAEKVVLQEEKPQQKEFHPLMALVLVYLIIGYILTGFVISNVLFSFYTYLTLALIFGVSKYFPNLNIIPVIISYPPYIFRFLAYLDVELIQLCQFLKGLLISKGLLQVYQALIVAVSLITQVVHPVQDLLGITSGGFSLFIFFFPRLLGFVLGIFF